MPEQNRNKIAPKSLGLFRGNSKFKVLLYMIVAIEKISKDLLSLQS